MQERLFKNIKPESYKHILMSLPLRWVRIELLASVGTSRRSMQTRRRQSERARRCPSSSPIPSPTGVLNQGQWANEEPKCWKTQKWSQRSRRRNRNDLLFKKDNLKEKTWTWGCPDSEDKSAAAPRATPRSRPRRSISSERRIYIYSLREWPRWAGLWWPSKCSSASWSRTPPSSSVPGWSSRVVRAVLSGSYSCCQTRTHPNCSPQSPLHLRK